MRLGRKKGINLLELMIVVIIIGVLVGIAIPQYLNVVERQKASEAVQLLGLLRQAQIRYQAANGSYAGIVGVGASPCNTVGLDVDWTVRAFFEEPDCYSDPTRSIVGIRRNSNVAATYGQYNLEIFEDGDIDCTGVAVSVCNKLGYY